MTILTIILLLTIITYNIKKGTKSLHMLQQNLYNENNRYLKWLFKNKKQNISIPTLLCTFLSILLLFIKNKIIISTIIILMILLYLYAVYSDIKKTNPNQTKKPLVYTKRIKRLIITCFILYLLPIILLFTIESNYIIILILTIMSTFNSIVIFIAMLINTPCEKLIYKYYETKAKDKLSNMKNLKVIGITGSYGKTSCKNILNDILNVKYNSLPTPKSLNTYNGLMITINNKLDKFDDVFIAEMGAYVKGDIKGLCDLVKPKYGIITSIGLCHLATFGSEENIIEGKMELIESLPTDGVGILNADDIKQVNYKIKNKCKILWIGIDNKKADVYATNIKCNSEGTNFDCIFKGDKTKYHFETRLLGKHSVYNILSAIALGYYLNMSIDELRLGVRKARPVEHRLEIKKIGTFYQIDDAYNSNPQGAKAALDVLNMMDGYKVVVTPGMIELGDKEIEANKEFGRQISEVADKVILVGSKKTLPIYEGLLDKGYSKDDIIVTNDVKETYVIISRMKEKKDIYALFENDLPDTYNE